MFNIQSSQNLMNAKSRSNRQIADLSDIVERKKERIKTNKLNDIKKVIFEKSEREQKLKQREKEHEKYEQEQQKEKARIR